MKVTYKGQANSMRSGGVNFIKGAEFDVSKEVAEYLKKTFGDAFEVEVVKEVVKPKPKPKPKAVVKPKEVKES